MKTNSDIRNNDLCEDFRFLVDKKEFLERCINAMTVAEVRRIMDAAEKLEIPEYRTRPAVDVLFEIASKLSFIDSERVSPVRIMEAIDNFLEAN